MNTKFFVRLIFVFACVFAPAVAGEASAQTIDFTNLQFPSSLTTTGGQTVDYIYGRFYEAGVTEAAGPSASVTAQIGYGALNSDPRTAPGWTWRAASFNVQSGNDDEYVGGFILPTHTSTVQYSYTYRFSVNGGTTWTYADLDGNGTMPGLSFSTARLGVMTVNPGVLAPTAAPVSVAGRVLGRNGRGVSRAFVDFTDQAGVTRTVATNPLGYYRINALDAGAPFVVTVRAKRLQFEAQLVSPSDNLSGLNFVAK